MTMSTALVAKAEVDVGMFSCSWVVAEVAGLATWKGPRREMVRVGRPVLAPVGPVAPVFPVLPVLPMVPWLPVGPVGPVAPVLPVLPVLPWTPCGPVGPVG